MIAAKPNSGIEKVLDDLASQSGEPTNPYLTGITGKLKEGKDLSDNEAREAMKLLMSEEVTQFQQAEFLVAMQHKGPTAEELASFALTLRELALPLPLELQSCQFPLGDTCGTGGGSLATFNVSTATMFVLAAAGITMAKHGNRAVTSSCGSADVLEALGVKIDLKPGSVKKCIERLGIGFLFAPLFHKAFKNVGAVRKKLGPYTQTVFNLLGPLVNPAFGSCGKTIPCIHVLGVNDPELVEKFAQVLKILNLNRAMVVYGVDGNRGMDEISTVGKTKISELSSDGQIKNYWICGEEFGLEKASCENLIGGSPQRNASIIIDILAGKETGPKRDIVLLNAAAGFYIAGKAKSISAGIELSRSMIENGSAKKKLDELAHFTNHEA